MKKFFTTFCVAMAALCASATVYNESIIVTVNGVSSEQKGVINVVDMGDTYEFTLKNFVLESEDGAMGVGNVALTGITPYTDGQATLLTASSIVSITAGDDTSIPFWMADMLPPVPVEMQGVMENGHLRCVLKIDLQEALQQTVLVEIGAGYQLRNQGFEAWHTSTDSYVEPIAWHSFESATGTLAALAGHHIEKSSDAHSGEASVRIFSTSIFGIVANGTMTTGRMNAGAMFATDPANNAYMDCSLTEVDGNGDPFYTPLYARPDSVALWVKFSQGTANADHPYATMSAVITDGTYFQDPEDKVYNNVVARAKNATIATTGGAWKRVSAPFVYTDNNVEPQAVLMTVSTNAAPGQGSNGDEVLADDAALIYNHALKSLKVKGQQPTGFDPATLDYNISIEGEMTVDDIEAEADGLSSHVMKGVVPVDGGYNCQLTVIAGDMSASTVYSIAVAATPSAIASLSNTAVQPAAYYTFDGRRVSTLQPGQVYLRRQHDGTTTKVCR